MLVLSIVDIIGTVAFAVSGVLVGIRNKLDLFGVYVLAMITASGGGIIRDVVIGRNIPVFFTEWKYFAAITASMAVTCVLYKFVNRIISVIILFDAIGLGVFTVTATYRAIEYGLPLLGVVFAGVITGVGGGILRDILVNEIPLIFRSEIYAIPSIIGSVLFYLFYDNVNINVNTYICIAVVLSIRMISVKFGLNLPILSKSEHRGSDGRSDRRNFRFKNNNL